MLITLFLDGVLGNVSIIEVCVCVLAGGVLMEERIGVKMNNEGLKCQRRRGKGEKGGVYRWSVCVCAENGGLVLPVLVPGVIITQSNTFSDTFLSTDT